MLTNTRYFLAFSLFVAASALNAKTVLLDRLAAEVNDKPIMYSEVQEKMKRGQVVIVSEYPAKAEDDDYKKALQDEVNFRLILQRADDLDLQVSDGEVENEINNFLKTRQLNQDGLRDALKQQGMTYEEYKEDFKKRMVLRKFQGRVINSQIRVSDKDIESYYLKKSGSTADKVNVVLRQIFIEVPESSSQITTETKMKRAQDVYKKLEDGMSFVEAAKLYSDQEEAKTTGGLMVGVKMNELSPEIRKHVDALAVGKFTDPIRFVGGFYIFYLEKKDFAGSQEFQAHKKELEMELREAELMNQTQKWLADERRRSKVRIIE